MKYPTRKQMRRRSLNLGVAIAVALLALWTDNATAGIVEEDAEGAKVYYDDGRIKFDIKDGVYVLDTKARKVWVGARQEKIYAEGGIGQVCGALGDVMDADKKKKKSKGDGSRTGNELELSGASSFIMAEKMEVKVQNAMEGGPRGTIEIKMIAPGPKIAGRKTVQYRVTVGGIPYAELWGSRDKDLLKELRKMDYGVVSRLEECGAGPISIIEDRPQEVAVEASREYLTFQGTIWILRKRLYSGDELEEPITDTSTLKKVKVPDSTFRPPKGYKKIPIKKMAELIVEETD